MPSTGVGMGKIRSLTHVQRGLTGPPVYCFHPLSGSAAVYGDLAAHLGRARIVHGLQSVGLVTDHEPDRTVPDMARRYADEIAVASQGGRPVLLGYSMGGVLAMEAARLLGDRPGWRPLVVAVDCDPLYHPAGDGGAWGILVHQTLNVDMPLNDLGDGLSVPDKLVRVRDAAAAQGRLPARFSLDRLATMLEVCRINESALARHVPAHFPGAVHAVRSAGATPLPGADPWHAFADEVTVSVVPTDHHGVMTPIGYRHIARRIDELLSDRA